MWYTDNDRLQLRKGKNMSRRKDETPRETIVIGTMVLPAHELHTCSELLKSDNGKNPILCDNYSDSLVSYGRNKGLYGYKLSNIQLQPIYGKQIREIRREIRQQAGRELDLPEFEIVWKF